MHRKLPSKFTIKSIILGDQKYISVHVRRKMEREFVGFGWRENEPGWFDEDEDIEVPLSPRRPNPPPDLGPWVAESPRQHSGWTTDEEEEEVVELEARWDPIEWVARFDDWYGWSDEDEEIPDPDHMVEANLEAPILPVDPGLLPGHHRLPPYSEMSADQLPSYEDIIADQPPSYEDIIVAEASQPTNDESVCERA